MNFRTTAILAVLVLLIGGYLLFELLRPPAPRSAEGDAAGALVFNLQKFEFRGLTIRPREGPEVILRLNDQDQWELDDPPVPVSNTAITDYVTKIMTLRSSGPAPEPLRERFEPAVTLRISILGGRMAELAVAAPNPVGDTVARVNLDNRVRWLLVPRDTAEQLNRRADDFRENRLVIVPADDIGTVTLQYADRWLRLTRDHDGWGFDFGPGIAPALGSVIPPGPHRAESFVVSDLTRSLTGLRAAAFPRGVGLDDGFDAPQLVIRYTRFDARQEVSGIPGEREVRFGRFEDVRRERVLALSDVPPVRALVSSAAFNGVQVTPQRLRDRRVFPNLDPSALSGITIVRDGNTVELSRQSGEAAAGWTVRSGQGREPMQADADKVSKLLGELTSLRAIRYLTEAPPAEAVRVTVQANERTFTLHVGRERLFLEDERVWGDADASAEADVSGRWGPAGGWVFESPTDLFELLQGDFVSPPVRPEPSSVPDGPADGSEPPPAGPVAPPAGPDSPPVQPPGPKH
ncbi:MAG: DUF4340 domain-containing protein [Tepidisphaerales bacterium]